MKTETRNKLQICLIVLATVVLIVMNVFTFNPMIVTVLQVLLASCWVACGILAAMPSVIKSRKDRA